MLLVNKCNDLENDINKHDNQEEKKRKVIWGKILTYDEKLSEIVHDLKKMKLIEASVEHL